VTILIEAAVESLDAALAAAEGGAHRLELAADLAHGGTTPDVQIVRACRSKLAIAIFVLVRPRAGDFACTDTEHHTMLDQIREAEEAGAQGIVTGELADPGASPRGQPHEDRMTALIDATRPLPVTFHRAFDVSVDLAALLERLI